MKSKLTMSGVAIVAVISTMLLTRPSMEVSGEEYVTIQMLNEQVAQLQVQIDSLKTTVNTQDQTIKDLQAEQTNMKAIDSTMLSKINTNENKMNGNITRDDNILYLMSKSQNFTNGFIPYCIGKNFDYPGCTAK